jgi:cell division inhibitor SulA/protein ImuA
MQASLLAKLQHEIASLEQARQPVGESISTGCAALDRLLPQHGLRRGTLVEWLAADGCGAVTLALRTAQEACREGGVLVVTDRHRQVYPPALCAYGLELSQVVFVHPRNRRDQLWALNQSLRSRAVAAVLCWPEALDDRAFRRLQLSAEQGESLGLLMRPSSVRGHPTWSELQLLVEALPTVPQWAKAPRRLRVEVARCRNGSSGASVELEIDDETGSIQESRLVHPAPQLAAATS